MHKIVMNTFYIPSLFKLPHLNQQEIYFSYKKDL